MGIRLWFKVFNGAVYCHKDKDFAGKRLGIDVSYEIYRASLGMKNIRELTDKNGVPTVLLNTLLCNVSKYKKLGVRRLIYVFDNPNPNPIKENEINRRKENKQRAVKVIVDDPEGYKEERLKFSIMPSMVDDVKKLLTLLGVDWIVAPDGYEAEHLGAALTVDGIIDTFITSDSDTLMFGAASMTRRVKVKTKFIYEEYKLDTVLNTYNITREEMVHLGVVLGSDFAAGTKGVGPKTIFKKGPHILLTEEQERAKEYFLSECNYTLDQIQKSSIDKTALVQWLVNDKNFNKARVEKIISIL
jgi:flap endonuclease-1